MNAPQNLDDLDDVDLAALSTRVLHDMVAKMTPEDRQRYRDALDAADAPVRSLLGAALAMPEATSAPGQKCASCRGAFSGMSWDTLCPSCWEAQLRNESAARRALASNAAEASPERNEAFEAVRKKLCALPRYSFLIEPHGGVKRMEDRSGNWIDFDAAHELFDPVAVDAALSTSQQGRTA
ncbi:hypothetical protein LMG26686_01349 [Achromobacter mucicolens]|uniref:hypothetical protein n=1 Tax=Achromobacter mucicolens TaxID=1389922 RepID=UPI0014672834|nr:hypothetical protein [Achromobacter mucicolens]CAB3838946.1 hypothetical protein LMG26686_01349 [Achromobacter mucicolens]